ncbi:organic hydroperoxide resistance protein [Pseudoroseomonas aestuarii]|uniref:Organic hydroperoxide resistance protein n=1 Tax=Teichococcus aestuarii TaxID=568898 RepID=A0A2U1UZZ9_9PROT|nr:organic hydroperoxide resistance protein [Pseudoroseomonas aestuarii]
MARRRPCRKRASPWRAYPGCRAPTAEARPVPQPLPCGATNPEQLFAAGYSACFLGAMKFVAGQRKIAVPAEAAVTAEVGIGQREDGEGFGITAALSVSLPGLDRAVAQDLIERTHKVCPYSHALRGNVAVETTLA